MDNAIDALKIAFAVLVFVMALGIVMQVFSQAKAVSDEVFYMTDKTNFYEYTADEKIPDGRFVSAETIIPTLYRYYKENFNVIIGEDKNNDGIVSGETEVLWEFNLEKEIKDYNENPTKAPWLGNANIDTKKRVDIEVFGNPNNKEKINGYDWNSQGHKDGFLAFVKKQETENGKCEFIETFREIRYSGKEVTIVTNENGELVLKEVGDQPGETQNTENGTLDLVQGNTKIEITYKLINEKDNKE